MLIASKSLVISKQSHFNTSHISFENIQKFWVLAMFFNIKNCKFVLVKLLRPEGFLRAVVSLPLMQDIKLMMSETTRFRQVCKWEVHSMVPWKRLRSLLSLWCLSVLQKLAWCARTLTWLHGGGASRVHTYTRTCLLGISLENS